MLTIISSGWARNPLAKSQVSKSGGAYYNNLCTRYHIHRLQFNGLWQAQGGKCSHCAAPLAHPTDATLPPGLKPKLRTTRTGELALVCELCRGKV